MNNNDITIFAETNFRNQKRRFGIKKDDRRRHMYLIGKTGMGKSTMLENMIVEDIRAGKGIAVVDPHGDLVEKIINYIPSRRVNDVINFDPSDMDYPVAFNPLESIDPRYKHLISSGLISVFKKLWADSWGPRLEYLLRNAILALLDTNGTTLLGIMRLLVDKGYRKKIISNIKDPVVRAFWVEEYSKYPDKFQVEAISPIQNKVGQFLSNFLIRNIVGQVKSSFDMREVMDEGQILLVNLSKGRIGEDTSSLLGSMMITKIQLAAMDRINIAEEKRRDFYLYVDEFQNFATDSFATILSEARKYHLNLIMAHQYIEQLNEVVRPAVFGNVGTMVVFRVGAADAEELVKEFTPKFLEEDLVNIPKWECYMKLMVDGIATDPFSARGLSPLSAGEMENNKEKIIKLSRERYAEKRDIIEEKISRWSGSDSSQENNETKKQQNNESMHYGISGRGDDNNSGIQSPAIKAGQEFRNSEINGNVNNLVNGYDAVCSACGKEIQVKFKPDGIRSVFCKECLKKFKKGELNFQDLPAQTGNNKTCLALSESRRATKPVSPLASQGEQESLPRLARVKADKKSSQENKLPTGQATKQEQESCLHKADNGGIEKKDAKIKKEMVIKHKSIAFALNENSQRTNMEDENKFPVVSLSRALKKGAIDFKGKRIVNSSIDIAKSEGAKKHDGEFASFENKKFNSLNNEKRQKLHSRVLPARTEDSNMGIKKFANSNEKNSSKSDKQEKKLSRGQIIKL